MRFDVVFCDVTTPFPYEHETLKYRGIGGTEKTVILVAEALAAQGLKVAVLEHNLDRPLSGPNAYYLPTAMISSIDCLNYVALRGCQYAEAFPHAKKFTFHQDVPNHLVLKLKPAILKHDFTVVCASGWHKTVMKELICDPNDTVNPRVTYIYNPVPDNLYVKDTIELKYDKNKLVWAMSPHKGLDRAIELVERLIDVSGNPDYRLHIFNPGYFKKDRNLPQFVINHGSVAAAELHQHISESLCLFYPTTFEETFGCIVAEANAIHTPVLTNKIAALAETVSSEDQFVGKDNKSIIDRVIEWHSGYRPKVRGQDRFRLSEVVKKWIKLFRE